MGGAWREEAPECLLGEELRGGSLPGKEIQKLVWKLPLHSNSTTSSNTCPVWLDTALL